MHWMKSWFFNKRDTNHQSNAQSEIIAVSSKIETQTQAVPRGIQPEGQANSQIQLPETGAKFDIANSSKVDNRTSSRTRPNNPETRTLVDRVTRTIDSGR